MKSVVKRFVFESQKDDGSPMEGMMQVFSYNLNRKLVSYNLNHKLDSSRYYTALIRWFLLLIAWLIEIISLRQHLSLLLFLIYHD